MSIGGTFHYHCRSFSLGVSSRHRRRGRGRGRSHSHNLSRNCVYVRLYFFETKCELMTPEFPHPVHLTRKNMALIARRRNVVRRRSFYNYKCRLIFFIVLFLDIKKMD